MDEKLKTLYLELIKKSLSFTLWPEPLVPVETYFSTRSAISRVSLKLLSGVLKIFNLRLAEDRPATDKEREEGLVTPGFADTMIGTKRLNNIQQCVQTIIDKNIPGDLIETGVWRGGSCILIQAILTANSVSDRNVFVADSFSGLPKPDAEKYPADKGDKHYKKDFLAVSQEEVENNFHKYGLLNDNVIFLKGWFKDTLPNAPIEKLSVMRLDGDMYSSTIDALENLYPKLSIGGFCIIDDYGLPGCKKAVDDYRMQNNITEEMIKIDWSGVYWRKS